MVNHRSNRYSVLVNLTTILPESDLKRHVHSFIYYWGHKPSHSIERVIPDGSAYLVFALDGMRRTIFDNRSRRPVQRLEHAWLSGVRREFITIEALQDSRMAAIRFSPGGARAILGSLLEKSAGRVLRFGLLKDRGIKEIHHGLIDARDAECAWGVVRKWLLQTGNFDDIPPAPIAAAIEQIQEDPSFAVTNLTQLVASSGYSHKQFIFHFKRHVGLTPKMFQRIMRFTEIVPQVQARRRLSWAEISHNCGYYDQSHFIREFKAFSGYNPVEFLNESGDRSNFIPVDAR